MYLKHAVFNLEGVGGGKGPHLWPPIQRLFTFMKANMGGSRFALRPWANTETLGQKVW